MPRPSSTPIRRARSAAPRWRSWRSTTCRPTRLRYLDEPPTVADLKGLMKLLGIDDPRLMMRTGESVYADLALADQEGDALLGGDQPPSHSAGTARSSSSATGPSSPARPRGSWISSDDPRVAGTALVWCARTTARTVHETGDDNDDFSGVLRDSRHRQHGGGFRREPPPLLGNPGRPGVAPGRDLLRRRRVLAAPGVVLQRALCAPVRPPGQLHRLHENALLELGGGLGRPGLHDRQPGAAARCGPSSKAGDAGCAGPGSSSS